MADQLFVNFTNSQMLQKCNLLNFGQISWLNQLTIWWNRP